MNVFFPAVKQTWVFYRFNLLQLSEQADKMWSLPYYLGLKTSKFSLFSSPFFAYILLSVQFGATLGPSLDRQISLVTRWYTGCAIVDIMCYEICSLSSKTVH